MGPPQGRGMVRHRPSPPTLVSKLFLARLALWIAGLSRFVFNLPQGVVKLVLARPLRTLLSHSRVPTSRKILIACGGTGGHLFPGIAVAEALRARGHEVRLLVSEKPVDAEARAKYPHLRFETLAAVAKPPTLSLRMLPFLWKLWSSVRHCKQVIHEFGAEAVLGMGGFTSLPPVYAGHTLGLKTFIHDSNARPGLSLIHI